MGHNFESSRPEHSIQHMRIPSSHASADQKLDKKGRSPMIGQLPSEAGLSMPDLEPMVSGSGHGDSEYTGGGF